MAIIKLNQTNIKYKILTGLKELNLTPGENVNIFCNINGQSYTGHVHKTVKGRIDALSEMFSNCSFSEEEKLSVEWGNNKNELIINLAGETVSNDYEYVQDDETDIVEMLEVEPDPIYFAKKTDLCNPVNWGIPGGTFKMPSSKQPRYGSPIACLDDELIVIFPEDFPIIVYNRKNNIYNSIDLADLKFVDNKEKKANIYVGCMELATEDDNKYVYFSSENVIFKWNINNNEVSVVAKLRKPYEITSLGLLNGKVCYSADTGSENSKYKYGIVGRREFESKNDLGLIWGTGISITQQKNGYTTSETLLLSSGCGYGRRVSFTVLDMDYFEKYIVDSAETEVKIDDNLKRIIASYETHNREDFRMDNGSYYYPYYSSNYMYNSAGGCIYVSDGSYDFMYKPRGKHPQCIEKTHGCSVPEGFLMIDYYTALVKIKEYHFSVFDFKNGKRYDF